MSHVLKADDTLIPYGLCVLLHKSHISVCCCYTVKKDLFNNFMFLLILSQLQRNTLCFQNQYRYVVHELFGQTKLFFVVTINHHLWNDSNATASESQCNKKACPHACEVQFPHSTSTSFINSRCPSSYCYTSLYHNHHLQLLLSLSLNHMYYYGSFQSHMAYVN